MSNERGHIDWRPYLFRFVLPLVAVLAMLLCWILWHPSPISDPYPVNVLEHRDSYRYVGSFNRDFNDLNDIQLSIAKKKGIRPTKTREEIMHNKQLVMVSTNPYYRVEELTHSVPYLVPDAQRLLLEIGRNFTQALQKDTLPMYRPIVTSVTRTAEDVKKLRRGNGNASENSTHMYGTTFDISWKRFDKVDMADPRTLPPEELKHLLAIVLKEFHDNGRCYIKHERQQACFHITVR